MNVMQLIETFGITTASLIACGWFIYKLWKQSDAREKTYIQMMQDMQATNAKCVEQLEAINEQLRRTNDRLEVIERELMLEEDNKE